MSTKVALLYSGGSDSTLCAALAAQKFDEVHLQTYSRSGMFYVERSRKNAERLMKHFPQKKIIHSIIDIDPLFKEVVYGDYINDIKRFGFFVLSTCSACKFSMHTRLLAYCLDNGITEVRDGAVREMSRAYPSQNLRIIKILKGYYRHFGINYENTVYEINVSGNRTDWILYDMGIYEVREVKTNRKLNMSIQSRCHQEVLHEILYKFYYFPVYGSLAFEDIAFNYYNHKIETFKGLMEAYLKDKKNSKIHYLLSRAMPEGKIYGLLR